MSWGRQGRAGGRRSRVGAEGRRWGERVRGITYSLLLTLSRTKKGVRQDPHQDVRWFVSSKAPRRPVSAQRGLERPAPPGDAEHERQNLGPKEGRGRTGTVVGHRLPSPAINSPLVMEAKARRVGGVSVRRGAGSFLAGGLVRSAAGGSRRPPLGGGAVLEAFQGPGQGDNARHSLVALHSPKNLGPDQRQKQDVLPPLYS